ncbi:T9SS type A sorting domain-containing protein, partial [Saprospiraceae bacterium]|nr:T9SS type A sorting domain-containing protein [Saprospiraceae bacterium]
FDHWKIEGGGITSYSYRNQDEFSVNDGNKIKAIFVTKKENSLIQKVIINGNDLLYTLDLINDTKATVSIYSTDGSRVYQQKNNNLSPGQNILYLPELAAGYYIFNIANDNLDQSYPITIVQ